MAPDLPLLDVDMTTRSTNRSLDQSLVSGIAWTGIVKWVSQALSWAMTLLTVRLLAPTDYGLFGMAMVYIGLGQIVTEAGVSSAVIQRPVLTDEGGKSSPACRSSSGSRSWC